MTLSMFLGLLAGWGLGTLFSAWVGNVLAERRYQRQRRRDRGGL